MDTQSLIHAAESGATDVVEELLKKGVDVNARPSSGTTALIRAASNNHVDTIRVLLANGADVNAARGDGMTALILAAFFGHTEAVAALLEGGADLEARDALGLTAQGWALSKGYTETFEYLKNASRSGAKIPATGGSIERIAAPVEANDAPLSENLSASENADGGRGDSTPVDPIDPPSVYSPSDEVINAYQQPPAPDKFVLDETTVVSPKSVTAELPAPPVPPRAAPPFRSSVRLLAVAWFVIFAVSAALTYTLTKGSTFERVKTENAPNPPALNSNPQITQPPASAPPTLNVESGRREERSSVPTFSPEQYKVEQPATTEAGGRGRKSNAQAEPPLIVESAQTGASYGEVENRSTNPKPSPSPAPKTEDEDRARAAVVPRTPAPQSPPRETPAPNVAQSQPAQPDPSPTPKRKVIRWP